MDEKPQLDYEKDARIEHSELDVEWLEQADLARRYGAHVVVLREQLQLAELKLKERKAELAIDVRERPEETVGKAKPTIADVENFVTLHEDIRNLARRIIKRQAELKYAEIAHSEIAFTRKAALENLVVLHGQQYFAGPKTPRNLEDARSSRTRRVNANVSKGLKRRRKDD